MMKKMVLTILFIIVLALLVFAGCVSFSTNLPGGDSTSDDEPDSVPYQPMTYYIPATDDVGEQITNEEGSQVYIPVVIEEPGTNEEPGYTYPPFDPEDYTSEYPTAYYPTQPGEVPTTQGNVPTTKRGQNEPTTKRGQNEPTTKRGQNEPTTKNGPSEPTTAPRADVNEYDVFRSGTFYASGTMRDSEGVSPLKMAITPNTIYMLTKFEDVDMAILVADGKTYLIYPDAKAYLEVSSTVMKLMGLDTDDLINNDDLGFSDLEPLSKAARTSKATMNGKDCTLYEFDNQDGSVSKVFMNGNRLLAIETYVNGAISTATYIDAITGVVPQDMQRPNPSYAKKSVFEFMGLLTDVIE